MKHARDSSGLRVIGAVAWALAVVAGCAAAAKKTGGGSGASAAGGGTSTSTAQGGGAPDASDDGLNLGDTGDGCPSTCAALGADCGAVTDTKCGGVVQCGACPTGHTCGGGGKPNVCVVGSSSDACAPLTCQQQNISCGAAGDGCTGTLQCGTCAPPQTCGGDPAKPGQCGCTGVCAMIPQCPPNATTTLTGTVLDPAGKHPLYNALVYIPNNPADPGLQPFPAGIACDVCGATAAGDPLVSSFTAPDGTFTLKNVPVGGSIPLVVQIGRWRRQFTVNIASACSPNAAPAGMLTLPKNHGEGDIPRIAIVTGGFDPIECVLSKAGVQDTEFTNPGGTGHIQFYLASQPNRPTDLFPGCPNPFGYGATIDATTPDQAALFDMSGPNPTINQYDLVIFGCEGYEENNQAYWSNVGAYTAAGGRVFASDFAYSWMASSYPQAKPPMPAPPTAVNPAYNGVAAWFLRQGSGGTSDVGLIDVTSNPKGTAFKKWLEDVGVSVPNSGTISLFPVFRNSNGVVAPTQQWLESDSTKAPIHFAFNTPVGAMSANQCGRVVFSDWHADLLKEPPSFVSCGYSLLPPPYLSHGLPFPSECDNGPMSPQEAVLEFMLFDLTACVQPYTPVCTPRTCADAGVGCGPAGDGCGGLLDCGACPMGQFCGGGGPGKCGSTTTCTPLTCASQMIQCGLAGDGCGNQLDCGNCPTGYICGLGGPGKCGKVQ
jgi:hypothetical protein